MHGAGYASSNGVALDTRASMFDRLSTLRFPLIALVICRHNEAGGMFVQMLQGWPAGALVVDFVANSLGGIRVPVFFAIAGFVLFRNFRPEAGWFREKILSRARSVLLPLLAWTAIWMVLFGIARQFPLTAQFLGGNSIWSESLSAMSAQDVLLAFFGQGHELFLYPLWFLRDLFLLVLASPLIWALLRATRGWITLLLALGWLAGADVHFVHSDALVYFWVGSHLAIAGRSIFWADSFGPAAAVGWAVLRFFYGHLSITVDRLWVLCGVVALFWLSAYLARRPAVLDLLRRASHYSFFIFVAQEPLLTVVRRIYFKWLPVESPFEVLFAYFAIVALTIALLVGLFKALERCCPALLGVLNGGRG